MTKQVECPICQTISPDHVDVCPVCGAGLENVDAFPTESSPPSRPKSSPQRAQPAYTSARGEDDLFAPGIMRFPWWAIVVPFALFAVFGFVGFYLIFNVVIRSGAIAPQVTLTSVPTLSIGNPLGPQSTATQQLFLPTLTPTDTPTLTMTPTETPGPCEQVVGAGDTLTILAIRCGHQDIDVIDEIVQLNGLRSAESVQQGQLILIPWPTPTPGPTEPAESGLQTEDRQVLADASLADEGNDAPTEIALVIPTPTLQPGVMWYTVQPNDNILVIAVQFNANVEIMSQLNPEVTFSQCDYGMDSGGPNCIVQLYQGQQIRVPAPTPTPTLSPTPSGSETATPSATPTFNAPSLVSPGDRSLFGADEIVTLRWTSTGILAQDDVYLVTVADTTSGEAVTITTTETLLILPLDQQPSDGERHMFTWEVAVGPSNGAGGLASVTFSTPSRIFFWDSP